MSFSSSVVRLAQPNYAAYTPEDIANAVAFLTGPDGHWVNGQVLFANGGIA